jgi:hypothetical protein
MADRIVPGVSITVVREVVARPLGATGVLGIVGPAEVDNSEEKLTAYGSLQEFRGVFGVGSLASMPEVPQAFANGLNKVVVANLPEGAVRRAEMTLETESGLVLKLQARAPGAWGNQLRVRIMTKPGTKDDRAIDVSIERGDKVLESFSSLSALGGNPRAYYTVLNRDSAYVRVTMADQPPVLPAGVSHEPSATQLSGLLQGGQDGSVEAYQEALTRLESYADVDMVTISRSYHTQEELLQLYAAIRAHCEKTSMNAHNRVGFGEVPPAVKGAPDLAAAQQISDLLSSPRFVLVAPQGYLGAVIGTIAALPYHYSPTFKTLPAVADLSFDFSDTQLEALIDHGICAVDAVPRHGVAIVKGITTSSEQINVTRVADRAVRVVNNIAQDFIGLLNTQDQRMALQQRIVEAFTLMEREQAIVPSTDGKSPAFQVAVGSTQDDFAKGIVRVDVAVRPVRAIDYIYATINVRAF